MSPASLDLPQIKLASKSPRRKMLLEAAGFPVEVVEINCDEIYPEDLPLNKVAEYIANLKSTAAKRHLDGEAYIITADTVVVCNQELLGKPTDSGEAKKMLQKLSGNTHQVFTGVVIATNKKSFSFSDVSSVTLGHLNQTEIEYYIDRFRPFDKAGSYGIQDWIGWTKIRKIDGSYATVMGLPVDKVYDFIVDNHTGYE